jgi:hypothetical protein
VTTTDPRRLPSPSATIEVASSDTGRPTPPSRRPRRRLVIDLTLALSLLFMIAALPAGYTGLHIAASVAFTSAVIAHLVTNRAWISSTVRRRGSLNRQTRLKARVDSWLTAATTILVVSGLWSAGTDGGPASQVHLVAGLGMVAGVVAHVVVHRHWIATALRPRPS